MAGKFGRQDVDQAIAKDDLEFFGLLLQDRAANHSDVDRYARSFLERVPADRPSGHAAYALEQFIHFAAMIRNWPGIADNTIAAYVDLAMSKENKPVHERVSLLLAGAPYYGTRGFRDDQVEAIVASVMALKAPKRDEALFKFANSISLSLQSSPHGTIETPLWQQFEKCCLTKYDMHVAYTDPLVKESTHIPLLYVQGDGPVVSAGRPLKEYLRITYDQNVEKQKTLPNNKNADPLEKLYAEMAADIPGALEVFAKGDCGRVLEAVEELAQRSGSMAAMKTHRDLVAYASKNRFISARPERLRGVASRFEARA